MSEILDSKLKIEIRHGNEISSRLKSRQISSRLVSRDETEFWKYFTGKTRRDGLREN
jgi:hypothetical protein